MKHARLLALCTGVASLLLLTPVIAPAIAPAVAQSSQPSASPTPTTNASISFRRPLRVTNIRISNDFELRRSEYYFTIDFPADAVESLEKLTFEQVEGAGYPRYRDSGSYAFDNADRTPLPISAVQNNSDDKTITVEFDPPIEPGRQITVGFKARNPRSGTYVYQLTAFPVGATQGQYAGVDRFSVFDPSNRPFLR